MWKRRREENRQRVMEERKYFGCGDFGHITCHCRNMGEERLVQVFLNKFEVLKDRVMQRGEGGGGEGRIEKKEKKKKYLREVMVKIGLKQEEKKEGIVTGALLDSGATGLVMSEEFMRKHKFRRTKLEKPIYVRNFDGTLNYMGPIKDIVEVEIFFKGHKERTSIDVIGGQKWSVILGMSWLAHHNPEIDWKTGEVQITRCPDECGKK